MKQTDLRVVKTKEALHESLISLLKMKALTAISVTEICRIAKINRGTFYLHYGKVEDVFEEYFKEIMEDLKASYMEPYRHVEKINTENLDPATIRIFHHIEKYKKFYRIVFLKEAPFSYYYLLFEQVQHLFKQDLERFRSKQIDIEMLSAYQANAVMGMIILWYKDDFSKSAAELNQMLVEILNVKDR